MIKIIKERRPVREDWYEMEFGDLNNSERECCAFRCDADGKLKPFDNSDAMKNYHRLMELSKTDPYYEPHIVHFTNEYFEDAKAVCECGFVIDLWDQYMGASECPHCGRWHNMFGQTLKRPEEWEK